MGEVPQQQNLLLTPGLMLLLLGVPCSLVLHYFVGDEVRNADILKTARSVGVFWEDRHKKKLLS